MRRMSRDEAIAILRARLTEMTDEHHSACEVAARKGILCGGYRQWSFAELKQRFPWIVERQPDIGRAELERLADIWELAREEVAGLPLACDLQASRRATCRGWDEFSNSQLSDFLVQLGEADVRVHGEEPAPPGAAEARDTQEHEGVSRR